VSLKLGKGELERETAVSPFGKSSGAALPGCCGYREDVDIGSLRP